MEITLSLVREIIEETGRRGVKVNINMVIRRISHENVSVEDLVLLLKFCLLTFFLFSTKCFVATHNFTGVTGKVFG